MILTVTANPALDYTVRLDTLEIGKRAKYRDPFIDPAGKGINVARMVRRLGEPTLALGFAAGPTGDLLRQRLTQLDPKSETARQGYVLLGNAQDSLGRLPDAVLAWRTALAIRFDATLAAQIAETQARLDGQVTPATAALFRRALDAAPPDAPWRALAEQRLTEAVK